MSTTIPPIAVVTCTTNHGNTALGLVIILLFVGAIYLQFSMHKRVASWLPPMRSWHFFDPSMQDCAIGREESPRGLPLGLRAVGGSPIRCDDMTIGGGPAPRGVTRFPIPGTFRVTL
jgi:hypothetical protein